MSCKDFVMHSRVKECSSITPTEIAAFLSGILSVVDCDCWPIPLVAVCSPGACVLPNVRVR